MNSFIRSIWIKFFGSPNRRAVFWSGFEKAATFAVHFGIQIILARLLCPDDYTVVAMLAIFFYISQAFIDSGFPTALIQRKDCTQVDYNSVFYFNIVLGIIMYGLLYIMAPYVENFYGFPNLSAVMRAYCLVLLIACTNSVNRVQLVRDLRFKQLAAVTFSSSLLSAIPAIIMAYYGFGYWSLVVQALTSAVLTTFLLYFYSRWRPSLIFSFKTLSALSRFGMRVLIIQIFQAIYNNIYSLLIGKKYAPQDLGYYDRGKSLAGNFTIGFSDFFTRALFPIQSKLQDNMVAIRNSFRKSLNLECMIIVPICAFLFMFANQTILTLFGEKWIQAGWILAVLVIGHMFYPFQALNINIIKSLGNSKILLKAEIVKKITSLIIVFIAIQYEFNLLVTAWSISAIIEYLISCYYCKKVSIITLKDFLFPIIVAAFISFPCAYISLIIVSYFSNFVMQLFCGGIIYILIIFLVYRLILSRFLKN